MKKEHQIEQKLFSEFPSVPTANWEEQIANDLKGEDYNRRLVWHTIDGLDVQPYYRKEDLEGLDYLANIADLRDREDNNWKIRQDISVNKVNKANEEALFAIKNGVDYIGFKMTRVPPADILKELLEGIDLSRVHINFSNSDCFHELAQTIAIYIQHQKIHPSLLKGSFDIDPFSNMMMNGGLPDSLPAVAEKLYHIVSIAKNSIPGFHVINVRAHIYHNSGASVTQQLGFALAQAHEYLVLLLDKGLTVNEIIPKMTFSFAIGSDYFIEIARLRAARLLFSRMAEQYGISNYENSNLYINSVNSWWNKSIYGPHTNMLRATTEAMSAIIGGTDTLLIEPYDLAYKSPDQFSLRIARNLQSILKHESFLDKVVDPAGGSYYIENLTDLIASKSWDIFREIEKKGGFLEAAKSGFLQDEIDHTVSKRNEMIIKRQENILGASLYPDFNESALDRIEIIDEQDTMPQGKMVRTLKKHRKAEIFETLRLRTEQFVKKGNKVPKVFLLQIGNPGMSTARAIFSGNFFGTAGYRIISNPRFANVEEGVTTALKAKPHILVICSSDEEYTLLVPEIVAKIKSGGLNIRIVVAGFPKDTIEQLKASGVNDFIHIKSNLVESLNHYHQLFGIK